MFNLCPRPVEYEDGETESQGKLILYNRAELKTSDHRQVLPWSVLVDICSMYTGLLPVST